MTLTASPLTETVPNNSGLLAYVIVSDNMRDGHKVGYRADVYGIKGGEESNGAEFLASRTYLTEANMLTAGGRAYAQVTSNGWFIPSYDSALGDGKSLRINITERVEVAPLVKCSDCDGEGTTVALDGQDEHCDNCDGEGWV